MVLVIALSLAVALLLAQFFILPMLLRQQIMQALHEAGIDAVRFKVTRASLWGAELSDLVAGDGSAVKIERIALDYSLGDLKKGQLDAIRVIGATVRLGVQDGQVDLTPLRSLVAQRAPASGGAASQPSASATSAGTLPVGRIELTNSKAVFFTPHQDVEVPVGGSVVPQADGRVSVSLQVGQENALVLGVELKDKQATFAGSADPGRTLLTVRAIWPDADVSVDGKLKLSGHFSWQDQPAGQARLEILPASGIAAAEPSNPGKLHLSSGVYDVAARFGDTNNSPFLRLKISQAAFAMADAGLWDPLESTCRHASLSIL